MEAASNHSGVENDGTSVSKALKNPLILNHIFAPLNVPDLKTVHLVCPDWHDVATNLLGQRSCLNFNKLFRHDGSKLVLVAPEENLVQNVTIRKAFHRSVPLKNIPGVITEGLILLKSTKIRHISLTNWKYSYLGCRENPVQVCLPVTNLSIPILPNLTSVKFDLRGNVKRPAFQPLAQALLKSAPNLTTLNLAAPFYLDLEGCRHLTVFKFAYIPMAKETLAKFDLAAVTTLLAQVKDSAVEMELRCLGNGDIYKEIPPTPVDLPVMSKLVSLTVKVSDLYQIQDFFDPEHLPRLKSLHIIMESHWLLAFPTFLNGWKAHPGVQSLGVEVDPSWAMGDVAGPLTKLFPAVKRFKFNISVIITRNMDRLIAPFQAWDLEGADVVVKCVKEATLLVQVLTNMATWKGVKPVHFGETYIQEDNFSRCVPDIIKLSGGVERVKISGYEVPEMVAVIRPMFEGSGAPITFTGGVYQIDVINCF